tara:strand:- start:354 stop:1004 length:651 start_codon:yes stop_codon:yes gene_type:complete
MDILLDDPMLATIEGDTNNRKKNLNRLADIEQNIINVKQEFIGMPAVCYELVKHIIHLRRDCNNTEHTVAFYKLLTMYMPTLLKHLDVRWLISVCDTFVDIGSPHQSAVAMNIVQCINRCNLDATIMINCVDGRLDRNRLAQEIKAPTWGGMVTADVPTGDMLHNMMTRLEKVVQSDDILYSIWKRIKELSIDQPGIILEYIAGSSKFKHQQNFFK